MSIQMRLLTLLTGLLAFLAVGAVLKLAQSVLMPLVIAWLLAGLFSPFLRFLSRFRVPRSLGIVLSLFLTSYLCLLFGIFLNSRVNAFAARYMDEYSEKMNAFLQHVYSELPDPVSAMLITFDWQSRVGMLLGSLSRSAWSFISNLVLVLIFVFFILIGQRYFYRKLEAAFDTERADRIRDVLLSISRQVSRYLGLQLMISAVTGLCVWIALSALEIDFPRTWGMLAFVLNFVPTIGSIIASIPPILIALIQHAPDSYWPAVATGAAMLTIQMTIGNFVAPKLLGDRLNLSPLAVLVSLLLWGWLWGGVGALLSVPITAAIKIVCDNVTLLRPIGIMLGSGKAYAARAASANGSAPEKEKNHG